MSDMIREDPPARPKEIPLVGILGDPIGDHHDGLRAGLMELAERCAELRRLLKERIVSWKYKRQIDYFRDRLRTIAEVAVRAATSSGVGFDGISSDQKIRLLWDSGEADRIVPQWEKEMQQKAAELLAASKIFNTEKYSYTIHVIPRELGEE